MELTIIITAIIVTTVAAIIAVEIKKRKDGKGSCSCGGSCGSCGMSCSYHSVEK